MGQDAPKGSRPAAQAARTLRAVLPVIAALVAAPAFALDEPPPVEWPVLPAQVADPEAAVPSSWTLESRDDGDLDGDGRADRVLVLRMADPRNVLANDGLGPPRFDSNPRMLVVALAGPGDRWRIAVQDHGLIPRPWSPTQDDYLDGPDAVAITARGTLKVSLHQWASAGSWSAGRRTYTFRHEGDCFRLIGFDDTTRDRASGDEVAHSVNYATRRVHTTTTSGEDGATQERWETFAPPRICLQDVGDGLEFRPLPEAWAE